MEGHREVTMPTKPLFLFLVAFFIFQGTSGLTLHKRAAPAVVAFDIKRNDVPDPVARDRVRRKRDKTASQKLDNEETLYFCNVTLGTPKQSLRLVLDTGSSDLWCNAANSTLCSPKKDPCDMSGSYDPNSSSSYKFVSSKFNITYADGTGAAGDYVSDTLHIGDTAIKDFQFGVGYSSSSTGYVSNEVQVGRFGEAPYSNLPQAMVRSGLIKSNAYSLWLNDLGAINGGYSEFIIALTAVSYSDGSNDQDYSADALPAAVLLDSGSSLTYLPDSIVQTIYDDLDVIYEASGGVGYVPCGLAQKNINITYTFSTPTITVSIRELVLEAGDLRFRDGSRACIFGIVPAGDSTPVLGDTFLRSAYVVYDIANNEISLANTNFNSTKDNILEIGTGGNSIPGAITVSHPVTSVVAEDSGARIGGPAATLFTEVPSASSGGTATAELTHIQLLFVFAVALVKYIIAY
ncbi:hypothetical protein EYZ11_009949 [Aspergillus tanneri]|uniref:Peptidase A1 domain-containing protein n=1 Tax=Aspergillus tanneri TaxID=1220188 RepID=A0A4S3J8R5_9EURO|nr:hypothetical protein EYZ11_009949 [Aspergillus tanneri]